MHSCPMLSVYMPTERILFDLSVAVGRICYYLRWGFDPKDLAEAISLELTWNSNQIGRVAVAISERMNGCNRQMDFLMLLSQARKHATVAMASWTRSLLAYSVRSDGSVDCRPCAFGLLGIADTHAISNNGHLVVAPGADRLHSSRTIVNTITLC